MQSWGYKLSEEINEEGMTATLRGATALWLLQTRGRITTKELADELSMKVRGARYLMDNLSLSRRFPITKEGIYWRLMR